MKRIKQLVALPALALMLSIGVTRRQGGKFERGKRAVLRIGDGGSAGGASDFESRQNPVFVDQYDCNTPHQDHPSFSVAMPTKGANALWLNGNAGTEGGMERSADRR